MLFCSWDASYRRIRSTDLPPWPPRPAPRRDRGTVARRDRTPRARCRAPSPGPRGGPRPPWRRPSCRPGPEPRGRTRPRAFEPRRRRSAGRRCAGSSGTRPAEAAPHCRTPCGEPGRGGAGAPVASASPPSGPALRGLTGLLPHELVLVPDALALVGLGLADLPDVRRDLSDGFLVVAPHHDLRGGGDLELDALGSLDDDRVREPHGKLEVLPLHRGTVADTDDLQSLLVAPGHALHHVGDEGSGEAVQAAVARLVARTFDPDRAVLEDDAHLGVQAS